MAFDNLFYAFSIFLILCRGGIKCSTCGRELKCKCFDKKQLFTVDCSNTGLISVPQSTPSNTTDLCLDNNQIDVLVIDKIKLPKLQILSLKNNELQRINKKAFQGMNNLKMLDLSGNNLKTQEALPISVFLAIGQSLKLLDIRRNLLGEVSETDYPVSVGELTSLEELRIDFIPNKSLPKEYGKLTNLTKLSFAGGRKEAGLIKDSMFREISSLNVTDVNLAGLNISVIGRKTF